MTPSEPSIRRVEGMVEAPFDDEMVALHVEKGAFYGFNATARRVWELLAQPMSLGALCATLSREFAVDADACRDEVAALLAEFEKDGLIAFDGAPV